MGCRIRVYREGDEWKTSGAQCKRGQEYAVQEVIDPRRVLTSSVRIVGGVVKMLPVRSNGEIPKELFIECVRVLAGVEVCAPVKLGEKVFEDICGTGVDVVATRDVEERKR